MFKVIKNKQLFSKQLMLVLLVGALSLTARADSAFDDCYKTDINFADDPDLTREERIQAMNEALFESINRFEECMSSSTSSSSGGGGQAGGAGGGGGAGIGDTGSQSLTGTETGEGEAQSASVNSVAASELSGTEAEAVDAQELLDKMEALEKASADTASSQNNNVALSTPGGTGKAPEDIPAADNDDVIAAQIRLAAEIETDPEKKEKLWNEYRKYKGLPVNNDE